ncbi:hypothetical protein [Bradyrhizobium sp. Gha]|uniref:hypothetical protein n=1 Tax=Bradyrhizobium sp. Gha TaxID=1855318 RepID=UPI0015A52B49|nr:hypothetical protein [Bradyrhizobium sp. Gha]
MSLRPLFLVLAMMAMMIAPSGAAEQIGRSGQPVPTQQNRIFSNPLANVAPP